MSTHRFVLVLGIAVGLACSAERGPKRSAAGHPAPRDGGVLRYSTGFAVSTLDPAIAYDEISMPVVHALYDTLVDYEPAGHDPLAATGDVNARKGFGLIPRLAQRWTVSPDGLVYTFAIQRGVTFSDGTPLVAADFVFSLERVRAKADSPFGTFLADVAELSAPTDHELVIRLARPSAAFIYVLAMPFTTPLSRSHVERVGDRLRSVPLGTGPFVLAGWDEGRRIELRRNSRYWQPARTHLDAIVLLENVPRDTQFMLFERGQLDTAAQLSAPDLLWVTGEPAWRPYVHLATGLNVFGSRMNVRIKPFDDRRVRQALNYAVNKDNVIKLLGGSAIPAHGMLPPGILGRAALTPYPHDPARARALLAEAGYPGGFDVEYVIMADEQAELLASSLQADLAKIGVRVRVARMAFSTYAAAIGSPSGAAFSAIGWIADYPDPTTFFDSKFHSRAIADEGSPNDSFYANPEVDRLLDAARIEPDVARRDALYREVERVLHDDAPWIWQYHSVTTEVIQPYVAGYAPHPMWGRDYTSAWLDLEDPRAPR